MFIFLHTSQRCHAHYNRYFQPSTPKVSKLKWLAKSKGKIIYRWTQSHFGGKSTSVKGECHVLWRVFVMCGFLNKRSQKFSWRVWSALLLFTECLILLLVCVYNIILKHLVLSTYAYNFIFKWECIELSFFYGQVLK